MNILVTGGCGYKGSVLVPRLLASGHKVTVIDAQWFGCFLKSHENLVIIKADIRERACLNLKDIEVVIHLAAVANDPCSELDPKLSWEIGALASMQLADLAARSGVKQFIYASSGSVYGIKKAEKVTEDLELEPISEYNKNKMVAERAVLSYSDKMIVQIIRPATVCGYSPRIRLDVAVNALTISALEKGEINVYGGSQIRPNIHIEDLADIYLHFLSKGGKVSGVFNAGFENLSLLEIAEMVSAQIPSKINICDSFDPRSYRINSDKLLSTGFKPRKGVKTAICEMAQGYRDGVFVNEARCHNLRWMKEVVI